MLQHAKLKHLLQVQEAPLFALNPDEDFFGMRLHPHVDVLTLEVPESISDVERLKGMFNIFAEVLL